MHSYMYKKQRQRFLKTSHKCLITDMCFSVDQQLLAFAPVQKWHKPLFKDNQKTENLLWFRYCRFLMLNSSLTDVWLHVVVERALWYENIFHFAQEHSLPNSAKPFPMFYKTVAIWFCQTVCPIHQLNMKNAIFCVCLLGFS